MELTGLYITVWIRGQHFAELCGVESPTSSALFTSGAWMVSGTVKGEHAPGLWIQFDESFPPAGIVVKKAPSTGQLADVERPLLLVKWEWIMAAQASAEKQRETRRFGFRPELAEVGGQEQP